MKLVSKNREEGTVVVEMTVLEAAALAAVYGEKTDEEAISLVGLDYGEGTAKQLEEANKPIKDESSVFPETSLYRMYELLDDIVRGLE